MPAADLECFALTAADFCLSARLFLQNSRFPFGLFPPLVVFVLLLFNGRRWAGFGFRGSGVMFGVEAALGFLSET